MELHHISIEDSYLNVQASKVSKTYPLYRYNPLQYIAHLDSVVALSSSYYN